MWSSISTLAITTFPCCLATAFSNLGPRILHGPHHLRRGERTHLVTRVLGNRSSISPEPSLDPQLSEGPFALLSSVWGDWLLTHDVHMPNKKASTLQQGDFQRSQDPKTRSSSEDFYKGYFSTCKRNTLSYTKIRDLKLKGLGSETPHQPADCSGASVSSFRIQEIMPLEAVMRNPLRQRGSTCSLKCGVTSHTARPQNHMEEKPVLGSISNMFVTAPGPSPLLLPRALNPIKENTFLTN